MTRLRQQRPASLLDSRIMGGYLVAPTAHSLRGVRRAAERLDLAVEALEDIERYRTSILAVMDDAVIELRERGTKWDSLSRRTGFKVVELRKRIVTRIARRRSRPPANQPLVVGDEVRPAA